MHGFYRESFLEWKGKPKNGKNSLAFGKRETGLDSFSSPTFVKDLDLAMAWLGRYTSTLVINLLPAGCAI
jgi:hypothetical protein